MLSTYPMFFPYGRVEEVWSITSKKATGWCEGLALHVAYCKLLFQRSSLFLRWPQLTCRFLCDVASQADEEKRCLQKFVITPRMRKTVRKGGLGEEGADLETYGEEGSQLMYGNVRRHRVECPRTFPDITSYKRG